MTSGITITLLCLLLFIAPYKHVNSFLLPSSDAILNEHYRRSTKFDREGERGTIASRRPLAAVVMRSSMTEASGTTSSGATMNISNSVRDIPIPVAGRTACFLTTRNTALSSHSSVRQRHDPTLAPAPTRRTLLHRTVCAPLLSLVFLHLSPAKNVHAATSSSAVASDEPKIVTATTTTEADTVLLRGTVTLQPGLTLPPPPSPDTTTPPAALYITARPNTPDNVPRAILDGSRGKPPPVLVARLVDPYAFPMEFRLTAEDLTVEGRGGVSEDGIADYWWSGEDLIVSARWDTDGAAATRDPSDLVGRGMAVSSKRGGAARGGGEGGGGVNVTLQGRGFTGKLVTGKSKK